MTYDKAPQIGSLSRWQPDWRLQTDETRVRSKESLRSSVETVMSCPTADMFFSAVPSFTTGLCELYQVPRMAGLFNNKLSSSRPLDTHTCSSLHPVPSCSIAPRPHLSGHDE